MALLALIQQRTQHREEKEEKEEKFPAEFEQYNPDIRAHPSLHVFTVVLQYRF